MDLILKTRYPYTTYTVCNYIHYFYSNYPIPKQVRIAEEDDSLAWIVTTLVVVKGKRVNLLGCHISSNNCSRMSGYIRPEQIKSTASLIDYLCNIPAGLDLRAQESIAINNSLMALSIPYIVHGDMNDVSGSTALRTQEYARLTEAWWKGVCGYDATIHNPLPYRIDHILYTESLLRLKSVKKIDPD